MKAKIASLCVTLLISVSVSGEENPKMGSQNEASLKYTVNDGDTLGSIALRFSVALSDVRAWNNLKSNRVRPGDTLIVKSAIGAKPDPARVKPPEKKKTKRRRIRTHKVRRGDTYERIGKRYKVKIKHLKRWNPRVNPRRLQIGQRIKINAYVSAPKLKKLKNVPKNRSVSWGRANYGRLYNGMTLATTDGLHVRKVERAWGTRQTIRMLEAAAADVQARWPDSSPLHVGDLSHATGGFMTPHKSHQSGRDADISYYYKGNVALPGFEDMNSSTLDSVKTWHMFKTLIDTGMVEYIFVDYRLQKILYEYAVSIGYQPDALKSVIQYPRGRGARGIIRHTKGHRNHFHIRFKCDGTDTYCQ